MTGARRLCPDPTGSVAPLVALSIIALTAVGGIAFDYARMAGMHTELLDAADQAALAAASQLDGKGPSGTDPGACARAVAAASGLLSNNALFANNSGGPAISVDNTAPGSACSGNPNVKFYQSWDYSSGKDQPGPAATSDSNAKVVVVTVNTKSASFTLTPVVKVFPAYLKATAVASMGSAICKTPPVMVCNPNEPVGNSNENLAYNVVPGVGLNLVTGSATVPGNFGWLQSNNGPGANNLAEQLGYNTPIGDCQPSDGVTTQTGMDASVLNALNTRFDVYANGNTTCPAQDGGTCSPALNTRKDLVCSSPGNATGCAANSNWSLASKPYDLPASNCTTQGNKTTCSTYTAGPLPASQDPTIMGYPPDYCHMSPTSNACGIAGDGSWDRDAYFRVNYGWDSSTWQSTTGLSPSVAPTASNYASRYAVYKWELAHPSGTGTKGINIKQADTGNDYAFGVPSTGNAGVGQSGSQADRRVIAIAVLNCYALTLHGKSTGVPVATWMDVFLVQPSMTRKRDNNVLFSDKNVYVEQIGKTTASSADVNPTVIRRDKPYLIQ
ncbi:pilus assembly protein TadG-related protein [Sphingomonas sp. ASV193]|uniref:pilus assembly protein TadG-related protein n=1 Tax=Sphingomonas sp. ASV193 TaxID=3144405 RepID=UPI0032E89329